MKKLFVILSVLAIAACAVTISCKKETKDSIKIDKKSVTVSNRGEAVTLNITASGEFQGQPDAEWLGVSGSTITAAPNYNVASRTASVTFHCGAESATVVVNQDGMGPKDVISVAIDAMMAGDWTTFWNCADLTDAQKDQIMAAYAEKGGTSTAEFEKYEFLSETVDETKGEAVVKVRYIYTDKDPSEAEWQLIKRDGRWRIPASALGK